MSAVALVSYFTHCQIVICSHRVKWCDVVYRVHKGVTEKALYGRDVAQPQCVKRALDMAYVKSVCVHDDDSQQL